jgi:hypothetical protein
LQKQCADLSAPTTCQPACSAALMAARGVFAFVNVCL